MLITHVQVEKILKGNLTFSQFGFSLLVTRYKKTYAQNPSYKVLDECEKEFNAFIAKYGKVMANDCAIIQKL